MNKKLPVWTQPHVDATVKGTGSSRNCGPCSNMYLYCNTFWRNLPYSPSHTIVNVPNTFWWYLFKSI